MRWPNEDIRTKETVINYTLSSLKNTDSKVLNKILANITNQWIKKIAHNDQDGSIKGTQGWFNIKQHFSIIHHTNWLREKNYRHFLTDTQNVFDKTQHLLIIILIKTLEKGPFLNW